MVSNKGKVNPINDNANEDDVIKPINIKDLVGADSDGDGDGGDDSGDDDGKDGDDDSENRRKGQGDSDDDG